MITKSYTTTSSSSSSSSSSNSSLLKALAGSPSPRSVTSMFFYDSLSDDEPRHFLDSCYLCNKTLSGHRDIFMYGGDMPFCSEDCRQKKIDFDEKEEKEKEKEIKKKKSFSSSIKSFQSSYLTGKTAQESFWR
ncbi:hypothetical protein J5N97_001817 [Dioscorea zingiberensis]|uniref:FLZ-type domain-containing protein n=1 Tax=Dioscorea zingiberensis TaxID=325984 RepID=A0A9D5BT62_9LILI|nr:hypothetical protein J5N97_001817 [Dioscorea zingiberensis]